VIPALTMSNKWTNPPIDKKAKDSLWKNSQYFIEVLGEPREEGNELIFPLKDLPFSGFKIRYDIERKFLGRIYAMVIEAKFVQRKMFHASGRIELRYSGFFKKGKPFFRTIPLKKGSSDEDGVLKLLNGDQRLIQECSKLDIEYLRLFIDSREEVWKVEVKPYGGSLIHMMLPPMRYNVILIKNQAELILSIMKNIEQCNSGC